MPMIGAPFSENPLICLGSLRSAQLPTTYNSSINMAQAQVLTCFASLLEASGECLTVTQRVREASTSVSDSDDEQVPDLAIPAAFSSCELFTVQTFYKILHSAFQSAVARRFTNAAGKMFFFHLANFILVLRLDEQYKAYISTNPHGDCQPGSSKITHTVLRPNTRQSQNATSSSTAERVADFVVYDHSANIYTIVGEIECDDSPGEQQNIEQMVGVWRKNQRAMLGFTCNKEAVHLRVLLAEEDGLCLYYFPKFCFSPPGKLKQLLCKLAELFLAFTSFVDTTF